MKSKIRLNYYDDKGNLIENPTEGQIGFCKETQKTYIYSNGEWNAANANMGITMYDLNKQIIAQMDILEGEARENARCLITDTTAASNQTYFMLLCRDLNYYTLFKLDKNNSGLCNIASEVFDCVEDIGAIKSVEAVPEAIEIWAHPVYGDPVVMYLFSYDAGVIECTL